MISARILLSMPSRSCLAAPAISMPNFPFSKFIACSSSLGLLLVFLIFDRLCYLMAVTSDSQFHVLAVDDSVIDRKLIEKLLRTSSYQVTTVDSGNKALEYLGLQDGFPSVSSDHHDVDVNLIITDYCMPGMTGYDLLKKIKESSSFKDIPVVIMSSENVPSRITRCLEEGADDFILKPVRLADMKKLKPCLLKSKSKEQPGQNHQSINKRKITEEILAQEHRRKRLNNLTAL